jgi:ubiquinone/menaquinone biosynthesis C-methylase UbiE
MLYRLLEIPIFYNFIQNLFASDRPLKELNNCLLVFKEAECLELGAGTGLSSPSGFSKLTVTDINSDYLDSISVPAKKVVCSATDLLFDDSSFDVVFAVGLFHHLDDGQFRTSLAEVRRVLKNGGFFIDLDNIWPTRITRIPAFIVRWLDRGKYVRSLKRQREMISEFFPDLSELVGAYSWCDLEFVRFIGKNQK